MARFVTIKKVGQHPAGTEVTTEQLGGDKRIERLVRRGAIRPLIQISTPQDIERVVREEQEKKSLIGKKVPGAPRKEDVEGRPREGQ